MPRTASACLFGTSHLVNVTAGNAAGAVRSTEAWNAQEWDVE